MVCADICVSSTAWCICNFIVFVCCAATLLYIDTVNFWAGSLITLISSHDRRSIYVDYVYYYNGILGVHRRTERQTSRQTERQTGTDGQIGRQRDRQTGGQTDRQTDI